MRAGVRKEAVFETFEVTSPPEEYVSGLLKNPKRLASKYFYDDRGSRLFDEICGLKEYYPARAELSILEKESRAIAKRIGRGAALVELGSGTGEKGRILLERLDEPAVYLPLEISAEQLKRSVDEARLIGGGIEIVPLCLDYTERLELPSNVENAEMVFVFFPGSTIGNFEPAEAVCFLRRLANLTEKKIGLLIGVDLKKERRMLERAYDDLSGVTAAFNLNILARANRDWGADFVLEEFRHRAFYEVGKGRIVMQLESCSDQRVRLGSEIVSFRAGERITTEYSYKYGIEEFGELARLAGLESKAVWTDEKRLFSLHYLEKT